MPFTPGGATPVFGLPYLLETDVPDVAAASQQLALAVEAVMEAIQVPIGADVSWWSTLMPAYGTWALLNGQRLVSARTNYPILWPLYPGWQRTNATTGTVDDLLLPNTENLVAIGAGATYAPGATGGAATVTLSPSNIPQITSSVSFSNLAHSHGGGTGNESADHTHYNSPQFLQAAAHGAPGSSSFIQAGGAGEFDFIWIANTLTSGMSAGPGSNEHHAHGVNTDNMSATTGSVSIGSASPTGVSTLPPFVASCRIIRCK